MRNATKQTLSRALNQTGVIQAGLRTTRIVEWTSGWTTSETETGFVIKYHHAQNTLRTQGKTDDLFQKCEKWITARPNQNLQTMLVGLVAKGFDAVLIGETIVITNGHGSND